MSKTFVSIPLDASVAICFADLRKGVNTKLHVTHAGFAGKSAPLEKVIADAVDAFFKGWDDGDYCVYAAVVNGTVYEVAVSGGGENGPTKVCYSKAVPSPVA